MNNDIDNAVRILKEQSFTCVLCRDGLTYTSKQSGIAPMLGFISSGTDLHGFSAADRIIGRAAAFLFIYAGVTAVHGLVMSSGALELLTEYGVACSYEKLTDRIINRRGDGICPMEEEVCGINDPKTAYRLLCKKHVALKQHKL